MGLSSGPHGVKALSVKDFASAFQNVKQLSGVRTLVGVQRAQTLAVLDGNVMMNAIPKEVDTFRGYVAILANQINEAVQAAAHVVVVFDEPKAMTLAKRDEQRRRDATRQARVPLCSEDLVATITNDDYSTDDLRADGCNAKLLMEFRKARPRFYDAVCAELLSKFCAEMTGDGAWSLTFDGVDRRGGERGIGLPREAGILSTDDAFWQPLLARDEPIGEGDLKLTDVTQRVHDAARRRGHARARRAPQPRGDHRHRLARHRAAAAEPARVARRARPTATSSRSCASRSARASARATTSSRPLTYLCCDLQLFHGLVLDYLYGTRKLDAETLRHQPAALALLASAMALCGCDFVEIKGVRFDHALPVVREMVRKDPQMLGHMARLFEAERHGKVQALLAMENFVFRYVKALEDVPRMKRAKDNASNYCQAQLYRALWTCSYWHQQELKDCSKWGFASMCG